MNTHALIFANGAANDGTFVQRTIQETNSPLIIAADGGARLAYQVFGLTPHVIVGDMDSLSDTEQSGFTQKGARMVQHTPEKDETDLELALLWAIEHGIKHIRIIGAMGKRVDQTLGNMYLLAMPQLADYDVRLVSGSQQMWLAYPGKHTITGEPQDTLSLIPMSGDVYNISTENLYYPLTNETLKFGPARGMSNVLTAAQATVSFDKGMLLIVHTLGTPE